MGSVIQPFMMSNILPIDIVINEIFSKHYCGLMKPLPSDLNESICNEMFYFKRLVTLYCNYYSRSIDSERYFVNVFKNDFFQYIMSKRDDTIDSYTNDLVRIDVSPRGLPYHLYTIWCTLPSYKRHEIYNDLINLHRNPREYFVTVHEFRL